MKCRKDIAEKTTLHGVKDIYDATSYTARCFWLATCIGALVAMSIQLRDISLLFIEEETASRIEPNLFWDVPNVTICPRVWSDLSKYRELDSDLLGDLSDKEIEDFDLYMSGYFMEGRMTIFRANGYGPFAHLLWYKDIALKVLERYNGSLEKFVLAHAPPVEEIVVDYSFYPFNMTPKYTTWVSHAGIYYTIEQGDRQQFDEIFMQSSTLAIKLSYSKAAARRYPLVFVNLGGMDEHAAFGRTLIPVRKGGTSIIVAKRHQSNLVNMRRRPCTNDGKVFADYLGCVSRAANDQCTKCEMYMPRTPHYPEGVAGNRTCHLLHSVCIPSDLEASMYTHCIPPCTKRSHELAITGQTGYYGSNRTLIYILLAEPGLHMLYTEHLVYTVSSLFSATGGVVSLWCGASFISVIQIIYLLIIHKKKNRENPSAVETNE